MLRFISKICSVNISAGASGARRISSLVQEVLSELKSIPAKEEEKFLLLQKKKKKNVSMSQSGSVWNSKFPADKGNTRWVHCNYFLYAHAKACSFIYALHKRELWVSLS